MKVAVIGGGWAGLAAVHRLKRHGHAVTVFETAHTLGGRARRVHSRTLDAPIDNGQHILLGAYTETLDLMRDLGLDPDALFHRERLSLESADGRFKLRAAALPAPLHLLAAIAGARGLGPREKLRLIAITSRLQGRGWRVAQGLSVAEWLDQGGQSPRAIRRFWQPLCLAALNTPLESACAQLFAHVLRDSLGGTRHASDVLIPNVDLSRLWPDRLEAWLAENEKDGPRSRLYRGHAVRKLACEGAGVKVDDEFFDAAVVAVNAPAAHKLLAQLDPTPEGVRYLDALSAFSHIPIATLTLRLARPWALPQAMLLLHDDPVRLHFGQWLFNRRSLRGPATKDTAAVSDADAPLLHIVVSDAGALAEQPRERVVAAIVEQIREQTRRFGSMPSVAGHSLIVEKRATFAALPGLARPGNGTPWPRLWTAGDWTDTGYPAVLEGAVRSGRKAADLLHHALHRDRVQA
ncbi:MAG TPA: hydroxysqualene dehydroxylase HpnE [Burkholderiaceae bacterium]|nr:hydroxysqualene dehydroxylase HpnE [Burkholderiaceae bacterium]